MSSPLPDLRFRVVARRRPVAVVGPPLVAERYDEAPAGADARTPHLAPSAAVEVGFEQQDPATSGEIEVSLAGPDGTRLAATLSAGRVGLSVGIDGETTTHRSRRHGTVVAPPDRLALALTGTHLTAFSREAGAWLARGWVDLAARCDTRDVAWLDGLVSGWAASGAHRVVDWRAGDFGQLGLRDLRLVTTTDGAAYRPDGDVLLTATSAGPGFFDTGHTSVWRLDPVDLSLEHAADLYFERPDRSGAYGDHATHLVRDGDRWLVATSTWGDFAPPPRSRRSAPHPGTKPYVDVTLATSAADLTRGRHRLVTRALALPTEGLDSVGAWDPHLVRDGAGWLVGFVSARSYFSFHPALAAGPELTDLTLRAAAPGRRATEGVTLHPGAGGWQVLASDGADNPRPIRRRYPVFDAGLVETGTIAAPYLDNIGWPTLVPPAPGGAADDWLLVTFDGTREGGALLGYGTHGDVVLMRPETGTSS